MSSSLVKCLWCMFKCCRPPIYIPYRCNLPVQSPDSGQARQTLSISAGILYPNDSNNDTNTRAHTNYTYLEEFICLNIFPSFVGVCIKKMHFTQQSVRDMQGRQRQRDKYSFLVHISFQMVFSLWQSKQLDRLLSSSPVSQSGWRKLSLLSLRASQLLNKSSNRRASSSF